MFSNRFYKGRNEAMTSLVVAVREKMGSSV